MPPTALTRDDRAQAYTLEGFIGAMVVVLALLFALQAVVITPTSGGLADRTVQAQLQQEAQDALLVSSDGDEEENLSYVIRHWDGDGFHGAQEADGTYNASAFAEREFLLGEVLSERFADDGWSYNVELVFEDGDEFEHERLVYQGSPPSDAVTASYAVTLYEDDRLTAPGEDDPLRDSYDSGEYPVPPSSDADPPVYSVVEVRLVIW